ncbi:hypothetical protein B566_EDAN004554 [Ephemera danica]|nr:hypothetical protein B566_EDAN004554 [Ephemera danica]
MLMSSSRGALFGNTSSRSQNKNLVEFKAGKMTQKGKMVHPDKRKGLLYVYQSEDSLMHFCWKDRHTGTVEDYNVADGDLQSLLNTMSQQQLMQFFGNVGQIGGLGGSLSNLLGPASRPSTGSRSSASSGSTSATGAASGGSSRGSSVPATGATASSDSSASTPKPMETGAASPAPTAAGVTSPASDEAVDLTNVLTIENLNEMLTDPNVVRALQPHLPPKEESGSKTETQSERLLSALRSPQFQQSLRMFGAAMQSGQLGPVMQQFGVGTDAVNAANQGNMEQFVRSLEQATQSGEATSETKPEEQSPEDEAME